MSGKTPSLGEVLEAALNGRLEGVRVSLPGRIESYANGRATVQALVMDGFVDAETGEREAVAIAPMTDVPVMLHGSGDVRIKIPIRKGDPCWLSFSSSSIARLKATDGTKVVDPGDDRRHHDADVVAFPVPRWSGDVEDEAMIEFTDSGLIKAGGDNALVTRAEFLSHGHASAALGPVSPPILHPTAPPGSDPLFPGTSKLRG